MHTCNSRGRSETKHRRITEELYVSRQAGCLIASAISFLKSASSSRENDFVVDNRDILFNQVFFILIKKQMLLELSRILRILFEGVRTTVLILIAVLKSCTSKIIGMIKNFVKINSYK